ncbi:uncharacterized protein K452DRAFT_300867 [Aplosporella prunicola CBS 121167]|uniref:RING-type domain-containing protein n=1 Tax=Aplosporella prunicola CBS 121167 TaxID=1176127 RepID=A0A6A6B738_9PEZI|nr:uncharacterized protein K452DRAFT_300867 [Aplosporella prunicola CBS 121167]KAF2138797.1 hypothetical protein K452DRAFT_300867 [Aplosporella prunicola CBS 121167]
MSTTQAMPPHAADIIDLTSEDDPSLSDSSTQPSSNPLPPLQSTRASRPPRFAREIIDLSEDTPQDTTAGGQQQAIHIPSSPEVQIVSSRRIAPESVDLTDDDLVEGTWQEGVNRGPPGTGGHRTRVTAGGFPQPRPYLERRVRELFGQAAPHRADRGTRTADRNRRHFPNRAASRFNINLDFMQPIMDFVGPGPLDYHMPAFTLGHDQEPTPPPPTYAPPKDAGQGFTRSPKENEVVVCPNCDSELCTGPEDSEKRQVWIVKACGHAYCGECAQNRHTSKRKGKEPAGSSSSRLPQTFSRCVVKGCEKKCHSRSAMIQLFF